MATRCRIVLRSSEKELFIGAMAIKVLVKQTIAENVLNVKFPLNWETMSKRQRLLYLGEKLPVGWELTLFQEPKSTRRSRSLYWRARGWKFPDLVGRPGPEVGRVNREGGWRANPWGNPRPQRGEVPQPRNPQRIINIPAPPNHAIIQQMMFNHWDQRAAQPNEIGGVEDAEG